MATLKQIRNKADARLAEFWLLLVEAQNSYFEKHGKYFQLIVTDRVVDGEDTQFLTESPSGEKYSTDVNFAFNSPIPFQIYVHEWTDGKKTGYYAVVKVELINGDIYTRTRTHLNVDTGWSKYEEPVIN